MTKQELIRKVSASRNVPTKLHRREVAAVVDAVFAELTQFFIEAKVAHKKSVAHKSKRPKAPKTKKGSAKAARFSFPGFGTFVKRKKSSRVGRHPQTGEPITIPETVTLQFVPGQELKQQLNNGRKR